MRWRFPPVILLACAAVLAALAPVHTDPAAAGAPGQSPAQQGLGAAQAPALPPQPAAAIIEGVIDREGLQAARLRMEEMQAHTDRYTFAERDINALGYRYLARDAFPEAIAVFDWNVRRFPSSDNVYDSLAEAAIAAGDLPRAEATLAAWLAKSPQDAKVPARVAAFRALAERRREELRHTWKPGEPTGIQGAYFGQAPPGMSPRIFAPGIISMTRSGDYACTMSPDGKEFYFTRFVGSPASQWTMVTRLVAGGWTFPEPATFSAGFNAHEPHVSRDNKRIYWGWFRPVPPGEPNLQKMNYGIWASERTPGGWSEPSFVGQGMFVSTTAAGEVYVTDHTELPNGYLAKARMANGRFAGLERLTGGMEKLRSATVTNIAHPAIAPDGRFILFDVEGGSHLYACFREDDGSWGEAVDLTRHGIDPMAGMAFVSPDGKYVFFGLRGDVYWVGAEFIDTLRPAVAR